MIRNYRREYLKSKRGFHRHPLIGNTKLSPMHRFLAETDRRDSAEIEYTQQWKTFFKAVRLGYITDLTSPLTKKGKAELTKLNSLLAKREGLNE